VQEIFDQMEIESPKPKAGVLNDKGKKPIPGLEELILSSLRELEEPPPTSSLVVLPKSPSEPSLVYHEDE
jgi:hypothetical protein